jgi:uncharacterized protein
MRVFVDADACPVKEEAVRVAVRHRLPLAFVSNSFMRLPEAPMVERIIVAEGPDAADDWIAERVVPGDIVVTPDIPLAARAVKAGGRAISPTGKMFDEDSVGMALAMRDLMQDLRDNGTVQTYNAPFSKADRSRFLQAMEHVVQELKRAGL